MKREKPPYPRNIVGKQIHLHRVRDKPKISQEDLCGRVARYGVVITRTQLAKIEAGRRPVFDYEVRAFAKALKVSVTDLL